MRILFLCNNYNPLSVACLRSLHGDERLDVTVGLLRQKKERMGSMPLMSLQRYGITETLGRGVRFALAAARVKGRKLGLSFAGYQTIREFLHVHDVDVLRFDDFNSHEAVNAIRELGFDLVVAGAFSQILGRELLSVPPLGVLNVHLSMLPKYRGPSPCHWVLKNRERKTGVTVHFMDERIDTGDIALQREIPVHPGETPVQLERRLALIGAEILLEVIGRVETGTVQRVPQEPQEATYYSFPRQREQMARLLLVFNVLGDL